MHLCALRRRANAPHGRVCRLPWGHAGEHQGVCILCRSPPKSLKVAQRKAGDYSNKSRPIICSKLKKEQSANKHYKGTEVKEE